MYYNRIHHDQVSVGMTFVYNEYGSHLVIAYKASGRIIIIVSCGECQCRLRNHGVWNYCHAWTNCVNYCITLYCISVIIPDLSSKYQYNIAEWSYRLSKVKLYSHGASHESTFYFWIWCCHPIFIYVFIIL
jgi:hypothetical protein